MIGYRIQHNDGKPTKHYVRKIEGSFGYCYTTNRKRAIKLTTEQAKRFNAFAAFVSDQAFFE